MWLRKLLPCSYEIKDSTPANCHAQPMKLHLMQMALPVPDDSLLCFSAHKNVFYFAKSDIFHLGYVLPSNGLFTNDGASLLFLFLNFNQVDRL